MNNVQTIQTIQQLQNELQARVEVLVQEFQHHPQCRGIQVLSITFEQIEWHNGYVDKQEEAQGITPEDVRSGPEWGYRIASTEVNSVLRV